MPSQNVSGIETDSSGERHIPRSVRPDGSVRKEIKVRPGYRPPEDVEKYKNKTAEEWKIRKNTGPPGLEIIEGEGTSESKGKNAKRREARKRAKLESGEQVRADSTVTGPRDNINESDVQEELHATCEGRVLDGSKSLDEQERQARNIKKKLRQARDLQSKKDSGESLLPEQFAKVIKISELIRQLDVLGLDSNGDPKRTDPE